MKYFYTILTLLTFVGISETKAAPSLNSYPVAKATIYLDFDGQSVSSSMWNFGTPINCLPAGMSDDQITESFNRVSEDFRPFDINVTTDLAKFLAAPLDQRIRVVITPTSDWYPSVSGIAYVTSFTWGDDTPCFVFSDRLSNDAKRIAEAISHESGHSLGLSHQAKYTTACTLKSSYNTGTGIGEISWGPIMGNVATKNLTQWNFGPTPSGCSYLQDNLSIITSNNGFSYRPDDFGDIYNTAANINVSGNAFSEVGVITTTGDKDIFRFDLLKSGKIKLNIEPYSVGQEYSGANLDIRVELQDSKGTKISTYDIADSLNVRIDTSLNAGTYYIVVDGTGNINTENDYGSLGEYSITGIYNEATVNTNPGTGTGTIINPELGSLISGERVKLGNKLTWKNDLVKNGEAITVLYTTEGNTEFIELSRPDANALSYIHQVASPGVFIYKLKIIEPTGSVRFSNTVTIDAKSTISIFKIIKQAQQPVVINATQPYDYQVVDNSGRVIQVGKAAPGTKSIDIRNYPAGIYNLKLINVNEQRIEKFMNG